MSLSWASPIQSIYPHPTSWRSVLILTTHLRLGLPSGLFLSGFPTKTLYPSPHPYAPYAQPISFISILSPAQYWVRSTNHLAPRYAISSIPCYLVPPRNVNTLLFPKTFPNKTSWLSLQIMHVTFLLKKNICKLSHSTYTLSQTIPFTSQDFNELLKSFKSLPTQNTETRLSSGNEWAEISHNLHENKTESFSRVIQLMTRLLRVEFWSD